jgi:hypothetical protein
VYRVLVGKPEGKRPLGRPRRRWGDNIRMDLQKVGRGGMDWIGLAQDRDSDVVRGAPHVTRYNTPIHNILSTSSIEHLSESTRNDP